VSGELPEQTAKGIPLTRQPDDVSDSGLVICSKTARREDAHDFITKAKLEEALSELRKQECVLDETEDTYTVGFSPGSIRVAKSSPDRRGKRVENWMARRAGTTWSNKSRAKMLERFSTLDFTPFANEGSIIAFLTLTYPSDWLTVAPSSRSAKRHLSMLRKRFEREFARPFFALWKMEFQRRGAPHFHLLAPIPRGSDFRTWLSKTWTEIVNHPDEMERAKHLQAGTGVDKAKGISADTAQRISYYFSKHSSANKGPKEYQNTPPEEWIQAGSVGRFWGYWGLEVATVSMLLSKAESLFIARTLRRWQRANRRAVRVQVWRVNQRTGEVRKRTATRRSRVVASAYSFRLVKNGQQFVEVIAKYFRQSPKQFQDKSS
jgi:hypothetical protein